METTAKEMVKWKKNIFYSGGNTHQSSTCLTFLNRETERTKERTSARERAGGDVIFHLASVATRDVCGKLPLRVSSDYCTKVHSVWKRKRWLVQQ